MLAGRAGLHSGVKPVNSPKGENNDTPRDTEILTGFGVDFDCGDPRGFARSRRQADHQGGLRLRGRYRGFGGCDRWRSSSRSIKANDGVFVGGGASILMDSKVLEVELAASYKFFTIHAQNGDIDWNVLPLDALVFYRLPNVRLGGGLTYHLGPTLKGSGAANGLDAK